MGTDLTSFHGIPEDAPVPNILLSYALISSKNQLRNLWRYLSVHPGEYRLLMDSGAFSVAHSGVTIPLEMYRDIVRAIPRGLHVEAFQLDVVDMPEKTLENYKRLLDWGVVTIPIFQRGGDLKILEECYQYSNLVGIAGGRKDAGYLLELAEVLRGRKFHLLGATRTRVTREIQPWSSDSVSWLAGTMYRFVYFFDKKTWALRCWHVREEPENFEKYVQYAKNLGFSREYLLRIAMDEPGRVLYTDKGLKSHRKIHLPDMINMLSWLLYAHSSLTNFNTRIFLAARIDMLPNILHASRYMRRLLGV